MKILASFFSREYLWEILRIATVGLASLLFYLHIIAGATGSHGLWTLLFAQNRNIGFNS
jgi:hypothetical protein